MSPESRDYDNAVTYLYSLQKHGIKLGLDNTRSLLTILGNPHKTFRSVHIAGTNGKGSTATALASILKENGHTAGLFTSPHLVSFTERISVNGKRISESDVIRLTEHIRSCMIGSDLNPTFFEFVTAMAFSYFSEKAVEIAVVETGMGGRLDATNVLTPELTIITNISLDHAEFLGDDIADITYEKAGIIKSGIPLVTAARQPDVIAQLSQTADERSAELHLYGRDFKGTMKSMNLRETVIDYEGRETYRDVKASVTGDYQLYNIATAIRACELLEQNGITVTEHAIRSGLEDMHLEGRLEQVSSSPPIYIDGAHNPDAAASLADSVKRLFPEQKIILIAGIMGDKNIRDILLPVMQIAHTVILTRATYERAASPELLYRLTSEIQQDAARSHPVTVTRSDTVRDALQTAEQLCGNECVILVTGSFYTTGEVKEVLGYKSVLPTLREHR